MPTTLGERQIAYVVHEVVRAYVEARGGYMTPWSDARPGERKAMLHVVRNVRRQPDTPPGERHAAWCDRRRAEGWRWGPVLDIEAKAHPSLMPWPELPEDDRVRECLMIGAVKCLMNPIPNQG